MSADNNSRVVSSVDAYIDRNLYNEEDTGLGFHIIIAKASDSSRNIGYSKE